ncbi:TraX family protein [Legionella hackeliae]|uniref:TrbP mating pair formation protein n=1 Tax=Legionella hackeliae TaxID=449 RepID=A0A0A8UN24_LEGHA|nr:TraX family protein [Legionella hackeliae]KTD10597.1 TraX protein [Legionella hackeliae]CEK10103.1 TrbP mating pair formation protein [Legionella hackeliae]STX46828.1 conjugal transfer protein TrbP [Legionella hackeliae]
MDSTTKFEEFNSLYPIEISSGTLEALKWLAVISMTIDHFNRFFFQASIYSAYCAGRLAMPLFAFIFAYNLARPEAFERGIYTRVFKRLLFFGVLATPAYIAMRHLQHLWPLNIMFMLFIAAVLFFLFQKKSPLTISLAIFLFFLSGAFVEYSWQGLIFCLSCWFFCRNPSILALIACLFSYFLIDSLNGNHWALASLPLIILATQIELKIPRIPYFFYIYYPGHLTLFWLVSKLI